MTPKPKSEEKRLKIIMAAIDTFSKYGLEKGTIATIAREAGIGKGTVYQYFQSKEEIFEQIIYVTFDEMIRSWQETIEANLSPRKKIELFIDLTVDLTLDIIRSEKKEQFAILMEIFLYAYRSQGKVQMDKIMQKLYKVVEPAFIEGVEKGLFQEIDPELLSFVLFSFFDGFGLHYIFQYKNYDSEKLKIYIKKLILNGLLK